MVRDVDKYHRSLDIFASKFCGSCSHQNHSKSKRFSLGDGENSFGLERLKLWAILIFSFLCSGLVEVSLDDGGQAIILQSRLDNSL